MTCLQRTLELHLETVITHPLLPWLETTLPMAALLRPQCDVGKRFPTIAWHSGHVSSTSFSSPSYTHSEGPQASGEMNAGDAQDPGEGETQGLAKVWKDYGFTTQAGWSTYRTSSQLSKGFLFPKWELPLSILGCYCMWHLTIQSLGLCLSYFFLKLGFLLLLL